MTEYGADYTLLNLVLLLGLFVIGAAVVLVRNLLISVIFLSIFSLLMALTYLVLGAPDVAITEAAIGVGASTFLFLAALLLTGEKEKPSKHPFLPLLVVGITAGALVYGLTGLPAFGDPSAITNHHVVPFYMESTVKDIGIPNVVTAILASYRGFDTLGETFVVFTAAMAVFMLLGGRKGEKQK